MAKFIKLTILSEGNEIPKLINVDQIHSFIKLNGETWVNYIGEVDEEGLHWGEMIKELPKGISEALNKELMIITL